MPLSTRYILIASMDVEAKKEALFNEVYENEHVPVLTRVPGVVAVHRLVTQPFELSIGGEIRKIDSSGEAKYSAIYEIESPDVLTGSAWAEAVERGRWPGQVRPYTFHRKHVLQRLIESGA